MKKILIGAGLILFGVFIGLGLAEGMVRIFYPHARDYAIPGNLFAIDDDLGWKLAPSKTATHRSRYFEARYRTNAQGFRDEERTAAKASGVYRILLYGDSLIFGWGLNDEERLSNIMQSQRSGLEVWNHGIAGWGLDQEIVLYEKEGASLNADAAIFFVGASTLSRIRTGFIYSKYKPVFRREPDGRLTRVPVPKLKNEAVSLLYGMLSPFYLPYFVQTQLATFNEARNEAGPSLTESRRMVDAFAKDLLRIAGNTARRRNHHIAIVAANLSRADRSELRSFCNEAGIEYLEIGSEIRAGTTSDENSNFIFGKYDGHWNAKANKLIATQLLAQMKYGP